MKYFILTVQRLPCFKVSMKFNSIDAVISYARKGRTVDIDDFRALAPRVEDQIEIIVKVFARGASIKANDVDVSPELADIFIAGMRARKRQPVGATASEPWNKASAEDRDNALAVWNMHQLSTKQMEQLSGYSYSSLRRWFGDEHPRPDFRGRKVER